MPIQLRLDDSVTGLDAVVFDCDGVLLETIPAKLQAYMDWMPPAHENLREVFRRHNLESFGTSRSLQLRYFYEELACREIDDDFLAFEVERFASICEPLCEAAPWAKGSREFVESCRQAGAATFVLSGTPQQDLDVMLEQRNAVELFNAIMGFPETKTGGLFRVLGEWGFDRSRTLFVGDAEKDASAAMEVGVPFVYRPSEADRPVTAIRTEARNLMDLLA
jgi:phosphoglycolate phosphatase-like HAD superfamily hydrolase